MSMRRRSEDERRRLLGELLSDDWKPTENDEKIEAEALREFIAGGPLDGIPEFRQHECWRMLHVWPDDVDETLPGKLECSGCGAVYRVELEHKP